MDDWDVDSIKTMRSDFLDQQQELSDEKTEFDNRTLDEKVQYLLTDDCQGLVASIIQSLKALGTAETDLDYLAETFRQKGLTVVDLGSKWSITIPA